MYVFKTAHPREIVMFDLHCQGEFQGTIFEKVSHLQNSIFAHYIRGCLIIEN